MLAVEVKDGKCRLVWQQDIVRDAGSFTPAERTQAVQIDSVVYLRATITKSTDKTQFYYSLDNKTYTKIGSETKMSFNLTVFVGARFGLFCYATQEGSEGYADFDWFSTEDSFNETDFYPATFEGYSADMLTAEQLSMESNDLEIMVGNNAALQITATYRDGHTENVAAKAKLSTEATDIIAMQNGTIRGLAEGTAQVTATYTDPMGNELQTTFNVRSTFFPFGKQYINTSLFAQGTYNEKTHTFCPGQWGQMGWEYPNGADMSAYKYLVIKLKQAQNCDAHLNIFTANSIWSDGYETPAFGSKKQIVVNLQTAKIKNGQKLDTKNIHIVCFWANGSGNIVVDDMYLTNNSDYSPMQPSGISTVVGNGQANVNVYSLSGQLLRHNVPQTEATQGLKAGIYIVGGKKIVIE
jgi:hypothetical protein